MDSITILLVCRFLSCIAQFTFEDARPNFVCIVVDDMGVDMVGAYAEAPVAAPCTPRIDRIAAEGVLFRNAWAAPVCSPTRAQILTGRYGFRNGIGTIVVSNSFQPGLSLVEKTLPEALPGYDSSAVGKWHLANPADGLSHPLASGFQWYAGSMYNVGESPLGVVPGCPGPYAYNHWVKDVNGIQVCVDQYATTNTADDAIRRAASMTRPWLLYAAFNAVHHPVHSPPPSLCASIACPNPPYTCPTTGASSTPVRVKAMAQALDREIGRMIDGIRAIDPDVFIFLIGDNGTAGFASEGAANGCFDPARAKGTMYEAGINVPFIAAGPGIVPGEVQELVGATDLFATIMDLAGSAAVADDSVSLVPYLYGSTTSQRSWIYAEHFQPNGVPVAPQSYERAIRNRAYKLIRRTAYSGPVPVTVDELYHLVTDPCESFDLVPTLAPGSHASANYGQLVQHLVTLVGAH